MEKPSSLLYKGITGSLRPIPENAIYGVGDVTLNKGYLVGQRYIGLVTGNRTFSYLKSFLCLSGWDHSQRNSIWKHSARGKGTNCQENQERSKAQKVQKKTLIRSPVRNISVSGLRIISRRRRRLKNPITDMSRSLWSAVIPKYTAVNTGDREKSEKRL